jgi:hypothetical protein
MSKATIVEIERAVVSRERPVNLLRGNENTNVITNANPAPKFVLSPHF